MPTANEQGTPWSRFLEARAKVIDWLYYGNPTMPTHHDDAEIARTLSMDPTQVMLIRTRDERPGDNKGQVRHV
jgi:hypothetical protein